MCGFVSDMFSPALWGGREQYTLWSALQVKKNFARRVNLSQTECPGGSRGANRSGGAGRSGRSGGPGGSGGSGRTWDALRPCGTRGAVRPGDPLGPRGARHGRAGGRIGGRADGHAAGHGPVDAGGRVGQIAAGGTGRGRSGVGIGSGIATLITMHNILLLETPAGQTPPGRVGLMLHFILCRRGEGGAGGGGGEKSEKIGRLVLFFASGCSKMNSSTVRNSKSAGRRQR